MRKAREAVRPAKIRATFHLPQDLIQQARAVVIHLAAPPARLTLAALAENALRREIERLKKKFNRGREFPRTRAELKGGRPLGS